MKRFLILLLFVISICFTIGAEARKFALLVGVNEYINVQSLKCCVNDMNALKDTLIKIGFAESDIYILTTGGTLRDLPTKENIEQRAAEILALAKSDDIIFFAFSGHGFREGNTDFFCPPFANPANLNGSCVSITKMMNELAGCEAQFKLMVVDACRNTPTNSRDVMAFQAIPFPPEGMALFQSCSRGEKSYEESRASGNGYFTKNLVEALSGKADANHDGCVTLLEVCSWTIAQTKADVEKAENGIQRPNISGSFSDFALFVSEPTPPVNRKFITVPNDFATIEEAYANAEDGGVITIQKGRYELSETFVVNRSVTFRGNTERAEDVVIDCPSANAFQITDGSPSFQYLTINGGSERCGSFYVTGGAPKLFRCVIASRKESGIQVEGENSNPKVESCIMKDCAGNGVMVGENGRGEFIDCEIYGNVKPGVGIEKSGNPIFTRCTIHDGKTNGVVVANNGRGQFIDCEIYGNADVGIGVTTSGNPSFTRCKIFNGGEFGVLVIEEGLGSFADCEIYGNARAGITVASSGNPTFTRCKIHDGKDAGVFVLRSGRGEFIDCDIYRNAETGVAVTSSGDPTFTGCKIHDGESNGVSVIDGGLGKFTNCDIYGNAQPGIGVTTLGNPTVTGCSIHDGKSSGVYIKDNGMGTFNNNTLENNVANGRLDNWNIGADANEVRYSGNTPSIDDNDSDDDDRIDRFS